jgi:hypothetical protein
MTLSNTTIIYIAVAVLICVGTFLVRNTSPYSRAGGAKYERRRLRRRIGTVLVAAGIILLGMSLLVQLLSVDL